MGSPGSHANVSLIYLLHYWYWSVFSVDAGNGSNDPTQPVRHTPPKLCRNGHEPSESGRTLTHTHTHAPACTHLQWYQMFSFYSCCTAEPLLHRSSNKLSRVDIATTTKQKMPNPPLHHTHTHTHTQAHKPPPPPPLLRLLLSLCSRKPEQTDKQAARDGLILPQWETFQMVYDEIQARERRRARGWGSLHGEGWEARGEKWSEDKDKQNDEDKGGFFKRY